MDLNKEAEEYVINKYSVANTPLIDCFIAGANSKHVQSKILQAQIDVLQEVLDESKLFKLVLIRVKITKLKAQLKQLND